MTPADETLRAGESPVANMRQDGDYSLPVDYTALEWQERRKVREQYVREQNGRCSHCGGLLSEAPPEKITRLKIKGRLFPANFFKYPVHLHHSHDTGMTIGAVHSLCNAVLWQYHGE